MTSDEPMSRLETLFDEARQRDGLERQDYLEQIGRRDPSLRSEIEALLRCEEEAEAFLDHPLVERGVEVMDSVWESMDEDDSLIGQCVGNWKVAGRIGSGGMGAVYAAERADGQFVGTAAIKVVKRGMDTDEILQRFLAERQVLASLAHPSIARLLDAGVTPDGRPFFVMERIEGSAIHKDCDQRRLDITGRLELFLPVCEAVSYAHQHLIVHRDLKPANILVTPDGSPRLLDFGIAKVLGPQESSSVVTRLDSKLGTPAYASPEQIRGEPATTSADIYSAGAVLYELLTGSSPKPADRTDSAEGDTPVVPSRIVVGRKEAAYHRRTTDARLSRRLRGDLDNIVMMALRQEPSRRYATIELLAEDIRRHLTGLPVRARADTLFYRATRFVKRNRVAVTIASFVVVALVGGLFFSLLQSERAQEQEARARDVTNLVMELYQAIDPNQPFRTTMTNADLVERGAARLEATLEEDDPQFADVSALLGSLFLGLGEYDKAATRLEAAVRLREQYSEDQKLLCKTWSALGTVYVHLHRFQEAEALYQKALRVARTWEPDDIDMGHLLNNLAVIRYRCEDFDGAEALYREALDICVRVSGVNSIDAARAQHNLASIRWAQGELDDAEELMLKALKTRRDHLGDDHSMVASTLSNLGVLRRDQELFQESLDCLEEALEIREKELPPTHPSTAETHHAMALTYFDLTWYEEAEEAARKALRIREARLPPGLWVTEDTRSVLGEILLRQGRLAEARPLLERSAPIICEAKGDEYIHSQEAIGRLIHLYELTDQAGRAQPWRDRLDSSVSTHHRP